ncbi:MAG: ComEC family competence protein, partial [Myxococcales bacterium]|nr:ComEC family competence protein [Myxococcales bacterium]
MNRRPALELLGLLALGIGLARWRPLPGGAWTFIALAPAALGLTWLVRRNLLLVLALPLGWWLAGAHLAPPDGPHRIREDEAGAPVLVEGILERDAALLDAKGRLHLLVTEIRTERGRRAVRESVVAYLRGTLPEWTEGTRVEVEGRLDRPHNFRNPGAWDFEGYLERGGVRYVLMGAASDARALGVLPDESLGWTRGLIVGLRARAKAFLAGPATASFSPEVVGILRALVVGDRTAFSDRLYEQFQATGVAHVLAISGMHLGIVGYLAYRFIKALLKIWPPLLLRLNARKWAMAAALAPTFGYAALTGAGVSTVRAAVMAAVFVVALLLDRENDPLSALGIAGVAILVARPLDVFSTSFQLSFAAVLAILLWSPVLFESPRPIPLGLRPWENFALRAGRWIREPFLISVITDVATAPLIAAHFQRLTWIGPLTNLLVIPLVGFVILPLGLLASLIALLSAGLGAAILLPAGWASGLVVRWIALLDAVPARSLSLPAPSALGVVGAYLALLGLAPALRPWRRPLVALGAVLGAIAVAPPLAAWAHAERPRVAFLEFDRGEIAWIDTDDGRGILVYGGVRRGSAFDAGRRVIAPFLADRAVRTIDDVVLPLRADRLALGMDALEERFSIRRRWCPGPAPEGALPCAGIDDPGAPLERIEGADGLLWRDRERGAAVWFAGPIRKRGPRGSGLV